MLGDSVTIHEAHGGEIVKDSGGDRYRVMVQTVNEAGNEEAYRVEIRAETTFRAINAALNEFDGPRGRRVTEILSVSKGSYTSAGDEHVGIQPLEITFER